MENRILIFSLLICLAFLSVSCDDDDTEPMGELTELEWILSGETPDTIQTINVDGQLILDIDTESLCSDSGVRVIITTAINEIYNDLVTEFPFSLERVISGNSNISVQTSIESIPNSTEVCVWLGEANCKLQYYN